ncbi:GDNF family receptor alpha-like [Sphaerodactylus townsendi]|uniref:GDNF family receptor alpha-like n=1 Tax=Sphaerodactylus townsendi TaxID=933632 RepID=UPI002026858F|nr:GDNF family receptor alpha-like [Sphaerodactylus townsendi]
MTTSTFQTSRCQRLRDKCSTIRKCESIWKSIESVCSIPGNSCAMQESENCHRVVKFLVTELPEFKHCNCTKDACDIQMLLGKECLGNQGKPELSSAPDIQIRFPQPTKLKEIAYPGIFEEDCAMDFKEKDHKNTEAEWESSPLSNAEYKPQHSCFRVQEECVSDTKCNKQFSAYLSDCQVRQTPCRVDQCKRALRNFYLNMPFNVAQKLTFCDCEELDENCLHSKELLHGKLCTDLVPARSCHSLFQTCQANRLCQEKYKVFTSKCLNDISQSCLENKSCVKYLDTKDFNCSDSDECRRAYIDMWGILRPVKCTYDVRSPVEQSSSFKLFYHIIQSHSCFSQIAGRKAENWPLFTELPETKSSATQKKSFFDGDTLYVAMYSCCTILILGLVLLALLKTRDFAKQAKNPSPAHLSERLMIPQQPWVVNCVDNNLSGSSCSQPLTILS